MGGLEGLFSFLPAIFTVGGSIMNFMGLKEQGAGVMEASQRKQVAANLQAEQLDINAGQAQSAAQRDARNVKLQTQLVMSRQMALAAASGAGMGTTVPNLIARTAGEGQYQSAIALYAGDEKARSLHAQAASLRMQGAMGVEDARSTKSAYNTAAGATLLKGAGSLFNNYAKDIAPKTGTGVVNSAGFERQLPTTDETMAFWGE